MLYISLQRIIFILKMNIFRSNEFAQGRKAQTINSADVLAALEEINFDEFVEPIKKNLQSQQLSELK